MIEKYIFTAPSAIADSEMAAVLAEVDALAKWAKDVKEHATKRAVEGKKWDGWKLVPGRTIRRYVDEDAVAAAVTDAGYNPFEQKLLGVPAMEKMLGTVLFEKTLSGLVEKPVGKPTLVPEDYK